MFDYHIHLELHFSMAFDGPVHQGSTQGQHDKCFVGPNGLLHWLEIQCGLGARPENIEYLRSGASELAAEGQAVSLPGNSIRMALAFVGILPIIIIYPMLQKYFIKGVVVGAVKG